MLMKLRNNYKPKLLALSLLTLAVAVPQTRAQPIFSAPYAFTNFAGNPATAGTTNGNGTNAYFSGPLGVAVDISNNIYVADTGNNTIRKVDASGNVTTLAGSAGNPGESNGQGTNALFDGPIGPAVDKAGNVYVADETGETIRKIDTSGNVTTLAGMANTIGSANGNGTNASFNSPSGVAVDSSGNVYVADQANQTIRKIDTSGNVTTLAGMVLTAGSENGTGTNASFSSPTGIAVDGSNNIYVADFGNFMIRKIDTASNVTTLAGSPGAYGNNDSRGANAQFTYPCALAVDSAGNVYDVDEGNQDIRKIDTSANVTTLAGSPGATGSANGVGNEARFYYPRGIAVDSTGSLYVAGGGNNSIAKGVLGPPQILSCHVAPPSLAYAFSNFAGNPGVAGEVNGQGANASFNGPDGIAVDSVGNVYVADYEGNVVRKVDTNGNVTTLAGNGTSGVFNAQGTNAEFDNPIGPAVDTYGNVYVLDRTAFTVRKIDTNGNVTTLAGSPGQQGNANGQGANAQFSAPNALAVDSSGNVYVADTLNYEIREIDTNGNVTTFAGTGFPGRADGESTNAFFNGPSGVAVDSAGNVYVCDQNNNTIRMIDTTGYVSTLAGVAGKAGSADGNGTNALFDAPDTLAVDSAGNIYVTDELNQTIRMIDTATNVTTLAGTPGAAGIANGVGSEVRFEYPDGIGVDSAGTIFVTAFGNEDVDISSIVQVGSMFIITWPGGAPVQTSTNVAGPWAPVPGAASPFSLELPGTNAQSYYRLW
jgi:sugar lactone lactonase YvrE